MKYLIIVLYTFSALAEVSSVVMIRGKIGNEFDEKKIKVVDSQGQSYFLPKNIFPEKFSFKQGQEFSIEVDEKELGNLKLIKK